MTHTRADERAMWEKEKPRNLILITIQAWNRRFPWYSQRRSTSIEYLCGGKNRWL
jgi:hypothetical protein